MFPPGPSRSLDIFGEEGEKAADDEEEEEMVDQPPCCRPQTAEEYVGCKFTCQGDVYTDLGVDLSQWSLIPSDTLRGLWPEAPWETQNDGARSEQLIGSGSVAILKDLASGKVTKADNQHIEEALDAGIKKAKALDLSPFPWLEEKTILRTMLRANG